MRQEVKADGRVTGMGASMTPRLSYLICATRRSGSTLLERLLEEAFRKGTTENGVLGTKIMWAYFRDFVRLARRTPGLREVRPCEVPASVLPNLSRYV
jgi:LPS sulfotransferase NodH